MIGYEHKNHTKENEKMKDKNAVKVSLGTAVYIFLIILVVINLGAIVYIGAMKNKSTIASMNKEQNGANVVETKKEEIEEIECTVR